MKRIAFFLGLAGAAVLPLAHLCYLAGIWKSLGFICEFTRFLTVI